MTRDETCSDLMRLDAFAACDADNEKLNNEARIQGSTRGRSWVPQRGNGYR